MADLKPLDPKDGAWLIRSEYHDAWHRRSVDEHGAEHATGYTDDIAQAGVFGYDLAKAYHDVDCKPGDRRDRAVPMREAYQRLRSKLTQEKARLKKLKGMVERAEQIAARAKLKALGPHQQRVLDALCNDDHPVAEEWSYSFAHLRSRTGLGRIQITRACRALRRLGFAQHHIGRWTEDGEPAGAGYAATAEGVAYWREHVEGGRVEE